MEKQRLFFIHEGKAAYPEIAAYTDFFCKSFDIKSLAPKDLATIAPCSTDVFWFLMGCYPTRPAQGFVVHDYRSLSVAPFAKAKDWIKKTANAKPDARIFLNDLVREKMGFTDEVPWRIVPMGVPVFVRDFAASCAGGKEEGTRVPATPRAAVGAELPDFCYIGAMSKERRTFVMIDSFLRRFGTTRRLTLFGVPHDGIEKRYETCPSVVFAGVLPQQDLFAILRSCACAVNYFPTHAPHIFQPPTKFLEYAALGLRILCNEHPQSRALAARYGIAAFWGEAEDMFATVPEDIVWPDNRDLDPSPFLWPDVLQTSGVADLLLKLPLVARADPICSERGLRTDL